MRTLAFLLALSACGGGDATRATVDPRARFGASAREVIFRGTCDASAAVALSASRIVVADDEDNVLRVYDAERGGPPLAKVDLSAALDLVGGTRQHPRELESDIEAAARVGARAYWLTSHGRDKKARPRPERLRFFATTVPERDEASALRVDGVGYTHLLDDLLAAPQLARFDLAAAADRAPKDEGGLNVEGLAATPDGTLLIGFRNPIPGGLALVVPLLDAGALVAPGGGPAHFGAPVLLDLGGRGVRALAPWRGGYLVAGGDRAGADDSVLYAWSGAADDSPTMLLDLGGYNPEALLVDEGRARILIVSDDGTRRVDGVACKQRKHGKDRSFRGLWIDVPQAAP